MVAQWLGGIFDGHELLDHVFDAGIGNRFSVAALVAGSEEKLHIEDAVRGLNVFVCDGAADCRFVDADGVRNLSHRARAKLGHAFFEKVGLEFYDLVCDALDRLLALLDGADEKFAGAHFLLDVFFFFSRQVAFGDHFLVGGADSQSGNVIAVERDLPLTLVVFDDDVR